MSRRRSPPAAPCPDLVRRPRGAYGWLPVRLLTEHHLQNLGPEAIAALLFLALTADRRGACWWSRAKMAGALGMNLPQIDRALLRLRELGLLAHRPWKAGDRDGVWQLLPLPEAKRTNATARQPQSLRDLLAEDPQINTDSPRSTPDSRAY